MPFIRSNLGWLGSRLVSVLDSGAEGSEFKSQPRRCRVAGLGKLFTSIVHQAAKLVAALLRVASVTAGLAVIDYGLPLLFYVPTSDDSGFAVVCVCCGR